MSFEPTLSVNNISPRHATISPSPLANASSLSKLSPPHIRRCILREKIKREKGFEPLTSGYPDDLPLIYSLIIAIVSPANKYKSRSPSSQFVNWDPARDYLFLWIINEIWSITSVKVIIYAITLHNTVMPVINAYIFQVTGLSKKLFISITSKNYLRFLS